MDQFWWIAPLATLIGGGAMGALLTAVFAARRTRMQPVGYRLELIPLFPRAAIGGAIDAKIRLTQDSAGVDFDNLHIMEFEAVNRGNQDLHEFSFGLTMPKGASIAFVSTSGKDRHHSIVIKQNISPVNRSGVVDFTCNPFNRGDQYGSTLYVSLDNNQKFEDFEKAVKALVPTT